MTATTPASRVITPTGLCPGWCNDHPVGTPLHSHDVTRVWGSASTGLVLGLALEREDGDQGTGKPRIVVQISRDGVCVDEVVPLGTAAAEDYAISMLRLIDVSRRDALKPSGGL